jgi:multimeric flavodoxin WrbA
VSASGKRLLIVFHSQTGNTQRLAEAVQRGAAREPEVATRLLRAFAAGVEDLLACDALLIGTPENLGYMSGAIKDFFDRTYYPVQGRVDHLPYAIFVSAGNDGTNTVVQIERIARGYRFKKVADAVIVRGEVTVEGVARCEELGHAVAAGLAFGIF